MFLRSSIRGLVGAAGLTLCGACGDGLVPNSFVAGAQAGGGGEGGGRSSVGEAGTLARDPGLGGPCQSDTQCDDGLPCSSDACDRTLGLCRFVPDDAACADGFYCNGDERCLLRLGCVPGDEVTCADQTACTIDRCLEETRSCAHDVRDGDLDGDPDGNCAGGGDCDDTDPAVSSGAREVCANSRDDDCDAAIDEADCAVPEHDVCADALEVSGPGTYALELAAARSDYAASCVATGGSLADLVVAIGVDGATADVELVARRASGTLALAAASLCGDVSSELACAAGALAPTGETVARLLLRSLAPGTTPVYVFGSGTLPVELGVRYLPPSLAPENETCGTAAPLSLGAEIVAPLAGASPDLPGACGSGAGDLVYAVTLEQPQDLRVHAASADGLGVPVLSLFGGSCASDTDELTCRAAEAATLFARALPAGTYHLGVSAEGAGDVALLAELAAPSEAPADESCERAGPLPHNQRLEVSLTDHTDDARAGCLDGAGEAVFALELDAASDVRLVTSFSEGDAGRVALLDPSCDPDVPPSACGDGLRSPVRLGLPGLPAGSHRVAVETRAANPASLTALVRPARPALLVPFADACDDVFEIPGMGARISGNTANAGADYTASCDQADQPSGGAPDQLLRLVLDRPRRVVLDADASGYATLVDVRRGPDCPGTELPQACAAGYVAGRSYLDLALEAGTYFVQVDGFDGASGPWALDVFVLDP